MNQNDKNEIAIIEMLKPYVYLNVRGRDVILSENVVFGVILFVVIALLGCIVLIAASA